jgi:histidinol dehydrogenase
MKIFINPTSDEWMPLMQRCVTDDGGIDKTVRAIIEEVKAGGDSALRQMSKRFDGYEPESFLVSRRVIADSEKDVPHEIKEALQVAVNNISAFHRAQLRREPLVVETMPGVKCMQRDIPISTVGLYIPGGRAPLFSTVLMLALPAKIAGCKRIVMCTPPGHNGRIAPEILYAAHLCGVDEVYSIGGAQAIAAMAFGTESIPKVDKIFGPGNRFVTKAKQLVAGEAVAIDMPAGPSEVLVMADSTANPVFVAADMLSQAEHGPDSQAIALCLSEEMACEIGKAVDSLAQKLHRRDIIKRSLDNCRLIVLPDIDSMIDFANRYAAEHLIISTADAEEVAMKIEAAGSIFIGQYAPESAGDYASGTNHTLPTGGWAAATNGINTDSFMKRITLQQLSCDGLRQLGPTIIDMARAEGLDAHALAVEVRTSVCNK